MKARCALRFFIRLGASTKRQGLIDRELRRFKQSNRALVRNPSGSRVRRRGTLLDGSLPRTSVHNLSRAFSYANRVALALTSKQSGNQSLSTPSSSNQSGGRRRVKQIYVFGSLIKRLSIFTSFEVQSATPSK